MCKFKPHKTDKLFNFGTQVIQFSGIKVIITKLYYYSSNSVELIIRYRQNSLKSIIPPNCANLAKQFASSNHDKTNILINFHTRGIQFHSPKLSNIIPPN